jgi:hypothetical protein
MKTLLEGGEFGIGKRPGIDRCTHPLVYHIGIHSPKPFWILH